MAKPRQTFAKKERETKRLQKMQKKKEKMELRKADSSKGKNPDNMIAYIDENGNLSATPPDISKQKKIKVEDIPLGVPKHIEEPQEERTGIITFFNESKGYGFIKDSKTQESIFVHVNAFLNEVKEKDKVSFEIEMGHRGPNAVRVKKIN